MLQISNVSITDAALRVLREERKRFKPRRAGEVFGLAYMSSFTNPDGTTVEGFHPGYTTDSVPPHGLGDHWAAVQLIDGPDFLFMPKFRWAPRDHYIIGLASPKYRLFSIEPAT